MLTAMAAGLGLGLSLIIAIGAQNLFVLGQGLRREHVLPVAVICTLSDAALIALGVSGVGLVLQAVPWLVEAVRYVGAAFLATYAALALRRAWHPRARTLAAVPDQRLSAPGRGSTNAATRTRTAPVVATCLALTWLNPHVYLDTVFLLGSVAATHGELRWWFASGAACASAVWFFALAYGARYLGRWLSTPQAWRIVDVAIGVIMLALAANLVAHA